MLNAPEDRTCAPPTKFLIFRIFLDPHPKSPLYRFRPAPLRGALRNVTDAERDAVDAGGALDGRG